jgi:hypothetical protein
MAAFQCDGVYAGIPYRVLSDCQIEAMMPGGLVTFKNVEQLIASAQRVAATNNAQPKEPFDLLANRNGSANVPASAQPLDYYNILLDAIKSTQQNSVHLRALVYERARFNFKRDILFGHSSLGLADLVRHVNDFELAVARIEATAINDQSLTHEESRYEQLSLRSDGADDHQFATAITEQKIVEPIADDEETSEETVKAAGPPINAVQIMPPAPLPPLYADFGPVQRFDNFSNSRAPEELWRHQRFGRQLTTAIMALAFAVVTAVIVAEKPWQWSQVQTDTKRNTADEREMKIARREDALPATPKLPYPVPTTYGIYALSQNRLVELNSLPINVPDPRVALSAEIKQSSSVITDDKPAFILFRRDLLNNAPQKMMLRVVAQVVRDTKIVNGAAAVTKVDETWRIRNIVTELKVSPVPGQPEMIIARLNDGPPLAAGRYALVVNRTGYDFTVEGPIKSLAFCLEGFQTAASGSMFNQCRSL